MSTRYRSVVVRLQSLPSAPPSVAQREHRVRFVRATALALADMHDPVSFRLWQEVASVPGSRFRSARGAAFSHYYRALAPGVF